MRDARDAATVIRELHRAWAKRLHSDPEGAIACKDETDSLVKAIIARDRITMQVELDTQIESFVRVHVGRLDRIPWNAALLGRKDADAPPRFLRLGNRQAEALLWFATTVLAGLPPSSFIP